MEHEIAGDFRRRGVTATVPHYDIAAGRLPPGDTITCGNRLDWPPKQRRHSWQDLGPDVRNQGARGFTAGTVRACAVCGADRFNRGSDTSCRQAPSADTVSPAAPPPPTAGTAATPKPNAASATTAPTTAPTAPARSEPQC